MKKWQILIFALLILLGFSDAVFLTWEHYTLTSIGCPVSPWINCLAVTSSKYSEIYGIPLALLGAIYYLFLAVFLWLGNRKNKESKMFLHLFLIASSFGLLFSTYLLFVQAVLIKLFCLYCLASAVISYAIFTFTCFLMQKQWSTLVIDTIGYVYKYLLKPILWKIDAEWVHEQMVDFGQKLLKIELFRSVFKRLFATKYKNLKQTIAGIKFDLPVGLAAGFDYEARLTETLPFVGFGFETVGTVTNTAYEGNPKPRLGRLPKSQALLVNKGFKSLGVRATMDSLKGLKFSFPVGVSLGRTNSRELDTLDKSIADIVGSFKVVKKTAVDNSYYELNISCPNLIHDLGIDFYKPSHLEKLLTAVDGLKVGKPIFIKMPIDQGDKKTLAMLSVIAKHKIAGVIFGNLQTDKKYKTLVQSEVRKFKMGKFSGKPTFEMSNHLIKLAYKNFNDRLVIIGTGGVFSAEDAWVKFTNGASLVQLITGMIFEGPQLISQINRDLSERLKKEGYKNISQIVGTSS